MRSRSARVASSRGSIAPISSTFSQCAPALILGFLTAVAHRAPAPVATLGRVEEEPTALLTGALLQARRGICLEQIDRAGDSDVADRGKVVSTPAPTDSSVVIRFQLRGAVGGSAEFGERRELLLRRRAAVGSGKEDRGEQLARRERSARLTLPVAVGGRRS